MKGKLMAITALCCVGWGGYLGCENTASVKLIDKVKFKTDKFTELDWQDDPGQGGLILVDSAAHSCFITFETVTGDRLRVRGISVKATEAMTFSFRQGMENRWPNGGTISSSRSDGSGEASVQATHTDWQETQASAVWIQLTNPAVPNESAWYMASFFDDWPGPPVHTNHMWGMSSSTMTSGPVESNSSTEMVMAADHLRLRLPGSSATLPAELSASLLAADPNEPNEVVPEFGVTDFV